MKIRTSNNSSEHVLPSVCWPESVEESYERLVAIVMTAGHGQYPAHQEMAGAVNQTTLRTFAR